MHSSILLAGSLAALAQAASLPLTTRQSNSTKGFSWVDTKPTKDLQYHDCGGGFQCARLEVPLDWSDESKNGTAAIAIVKLPATVPDDDPTFGGSILINPGGPSGSGTSFAYSFATALQTLLGGERNYEIIGFDPRGVNMSTPHADCYKGDELLRSLDAARVSGFGPIESSLGYHYQHALGFSQLCEEDGEDSIFAHMNTASVARDMVEIIDRIDDLRWKESGKEKPADAEVPRLQYLGISYGSYLGNVFASMFPERVGRVMIDAVIDSEDWVTGTYRNHLNDAEAILDFFYEVCFKAGEDCAIWNSKDKSGADIKGRVNEFLEKLETNPIPLPHGGRVNFGTAPMAKQIIFGMLYSPQVQFQSLANGLGALLSGNVTQLLPLFQTTTPDIICGDATAPGEAPGYTWSNDVQKGVVCSDTIDGLENRNMSYFTELLDYLNDQMPTGGGPFATFFPIPCIGRKLRPPYAFTGPFGTPAANPDDPKAPAAPLLITSSRLDPITPLRNAIAMQKLHTGSAVVIQEAIGHGFMAGPSKCIMNIIRDYFHTGKVPETGTVCEAACPPTIPANKNNCTSPLQARDGIGHIDLPMPDWNWL